MIVKSIVIYPIKGMKGTFLNSCNTMERGFEHDRRYMLIDKNNNFVSQRTHPMLALISPTIIDGEVHISYQSEVISFPLDLITEEVINARLFDKEVQGNLVSVKVSHLISHLMGAEVRLIKMQKESIRTKILVKGPNSTEVSFADGYPYLIAGTASLRQLNEKLQNPILMDRFRPNIVIETEIPHIEDIWESIKIGNADMMVIKPCARCPVVTIDQQTGISNKETLKKLSTYRKKENKVYFGANAISLGNSTISVGDSVVAL